MSRLAIATEFRVDPGQRIESAVREVVMTKKLFPHSTVFFTFNDFVRRVEPTDTPDSLYAAYMEATK